MPLFGIVSVTSGTCLACGATKTRFESQLDLVSGVLLVAGLAMIGSLLPFVR